MFSIFKKDPLKKLDRAYEKKLEQAMNAQRNGDIRSFAMLTEEAEGIRKQLEAIKNSASSSSSRQ